MEFCRKLAYPKDGGVRKVQTAVHFSAVTPYGNSAANLPLGPISYRNVEWYPGLACPCELRLDHVVCAFRSRLAGSLYSMAMKRKLAERLVPICSPPPSQALLIQL